MKSKRHKKKHYCDSCIFIGFLNEEPDKFEKCKNILEAAERDYIELYTSAFTMAEVIKMKKENLTIEQHEKIINSLFLSPWINLVQFERETAEICRYLHRKYNFRGTFDPLHLATAIRMRVDYFNTTDYNTIIKKCPQRVSCPPNYPQEVIIQEPFVKGYQPSLF